MTQIKPISIWQNGKSILFDKIEITICFDDLSTKAMFYYTLKNDEQLCVDGNVIIESDEYKKWNGENEETIKLVIAKLGLLEA